MTSDEANRRLVTTLRLCARAHPYYRRLWRRHSIDVGDIRGVDDLPALPLTAKLDFMQAPRDFVLDSEALPELPLEERTIWNLAYTTGTTSGRPTPFFNTTHDQFHLMLQARTCNLVEGLTRDDRIANLYPLAPVPTGAFLTCVRSAEIFGVPVVSTLTGPANPAYPVRRSLDDALDLVRRTDATVLWGVPSFVRRLLRRAVELHLTLPAARMVLVTGEPVDAELRAEYLEHLRQLGADDPQVRVRYAATEMQGGLVQCANDVAPHHVLPDLYHLEVVDPESGRPLPDGEEGMLALTHLHRRGTVLVRYLIGDVLALRHTRCEACGRDVQLMTRPARRVGELVKVRGMLLNPAIVGEVVSADRDVQEYQVVVRRSPQNDGLERDELVVRVEAPREQHERLGRELPSRVRQAVMVRPVVEFVAPGTLHDPGRALKARRFVDERGEA